MIVYFFVIGRFLSMSAADIKQCHTVTRRHLLLLLPDLFKVSKILRKYFIWYSMLAVRRVCVCVYLFCEGVHSAAPGYYGWPHVIDVCVCVCVFCEGVHSAAPGHYGWPHVPVESRATLPSRHCPLGSLLCPACASSSLQHWLGECPAWPFCDHVGNGPATCQVSSRLANL